VNEASRQAVPFYGADALNKVIDLAALIDWMDAAHKLGAPATADSLIGPEVSRLFVRSAVLPGEAMGAKVVSIVPDNPRAGRPSVQALFVLFDGATGTPRAILDATGLTYWKTAADSALGARYLAREDAYTLLMVGAGGLAPWLIRAHRAAQPGLAEVLIWNRTAARADELASALAREGIPASAVSDLAAAARRADVISAATMARAPLIHGEWLKAGAHLDLVGAYEPSTREADDTAIRRARLFTDFRRSAEDVGEFLLPIASGAMREADIAGDLYDLVRGAAGRRSAADITLFKNAGGAHLDLMTAQFLLHRLAG
jgi:ornithine cyclodeaminase/alanine dehydrogenase-like protein (mu-crystallin family)